MKMFKVGNLVRMKSGSPVMTVVGIALPRKLKVTWFNNTTQRVEQDEVDSQAVEIVANVKMTQTR
jgi:uncharacterized protein YodC (DUF2158 family)